MLVLLGAADLGCSFEGVLERCHRSVKGRGLALLTFLGFPFVKGGRFLLLILHELFVNLGVGWPAT